MKWHIVTAQDNIRFYGGSLTRYIESMKNTQGFFWPYIMACGILVPRPGVEPASSAIKAWSPHRLRERPYGSAGGKDRGKE